MATSKQVQLPFFPLNIVVFPDEEIQLYVFEPRYCELVHHCEENEAAFGIIPLLKDKMLAYGTEMEILRVKRSPKKSSLQLTVRGLRIFSVQSFNERLKDHLYGGGMVVMRKEERSGFLPSKTYAKLLAETQILDDSDALAGTPMSKETRLQREIRLMFIELRKILEKKGGMMLVPSAAQEASVLGNAYSLAARMIGLDLREKAILLSMEKEEDRLNFLSDHMRHLLSVLKKVLDE